MWGKGPDGKLDTSISTGPVLFEDPIRTPVPSGVMVIFAVWSVTSKTFPDGVVVMEAGAPVSSDIGMNVGSVVMLSMIDA